MNKIIVLAVAWRGVPALKPQTQLFDSRLDGQVRTTKQNTKSQSETPTPNKIASILLIYCPVKKSPPRMAYAAA